MQALASSRGVRVAPLRRATSRPQQQPQQQLQRGRVVVVAKVARSPIAILKSNAVAARRPTPPGRAALVVAAAAASSNNVPLVTRDEGPISEEAFSVR